MLFSTKLIQNEKFRKPHGYDFMPKTEHSSSDDPYSPCNSMIGFDPQTHNNILYYMELGIIFELRNGTGIAREKIKLVRSRRNLEPMWFFMSGYFRDI